MFVHDLDLNWTQHPFLRNKFKLDSTDILKKIIESKIRELYIDTEKGLDVVGGQEASAVYREVSQVMNTLNTPSKPIKSIQTSLKDELPQAQQVKKESFRIATTMLKDVRLGRQVNIEALDTVVDGMISSIFRNQDALLGMMLLRDADQYTFEHSVSVAILITAFCKYMEMPHTTISRAVMGGLLHDIGKTQVPLAILNKPGPLTDAEFIIMRRHVEYGIDLLTSTKGISEESKQIVLEHHERYDGCGYPFGKKGDEISLLGKMSAIIDCYDALTSRRCYHAEKSPHWVLGKLIEWSKYHFQPDLVQRFIRCIGIYPVGTLVILQSGRLAVVIESNKNDLLRPVVVLVYDKKKHLPLPKVRLDLSDKAANPNERIIGSDLPESYNIELSSILNQPSLAA